VVGCDAVFVGTEVSDAKSIDVAEEEEEEEKESGGDGKEEKANRSVLSGEPSFPCSIPPINDIGRLK